MKEDMWLDKISKRLADFEATPPEEGWQRLEQELGMMIQPSAAPATRRKRVLAPYRWWAAAAVLLVAVSAVTFWFMDSTVIEDVVNQSNMAALPVAGSEPDGLLPDSAGEGRNRPGGGQRQRDARVAEAVTEIASPSGLPVQEILPEEKVEDEPLPEPAALREDTITSGSGEQEKALRPTRRSGKDKLHLPVSPSGRNRRDKWALGLSVGNVGGFSLDETEGGKLLASSSASPGGLGGGIDPSSASSSILLIPSDRNLYFKDGIPYLSGHSSRVISADHKQPISFGVSVRKNLYGDFSLETGLIYTYLESDIEYEGVGEVLNQKLHYVGIPLRANWNFVNSRAFTAYISAGGAMEKCVFGKIGDVKNTVDPLQFSVMGAVGGQYNVSKRLGIYLEPGIHYYFDDGSKVQTIRKESPCKFTFQAGIRLMY